MKKLNKIIIGVVIASLLPAIAIAAALNSAQVGSNPVNTYYLQTNGSISTWVPVSGGGGSGGSLLLYLNPQNAYYVSTTSAQWLIGENSTTTKSILEVNGDITDKNVLSASCIGTNSFGVIASCNIGNLFSTTSANYWIGVYPNGNLFSTTSTAYWLTQQTLTGASSTLLANNNTFSGNDIFNNTITGSISGNAGTVTNGVYTGRTLTINGVAQDLSADRTWTVAGGGGGGGNVSTSSVPVVGNLAYWTTTTATPALLGTVGTSTLTPTAPLGGSFTQIGSGGSITCSTCLTTAISLGSLFSTTSTNYWFTSTSSPLTVSSILATSTATSTFTGPVVIGSGTTGTSTMTIGVAGLKEGCINFVTYNGTTWATSSLYMEGSSVISEANACR